MDFHHIFEHKALIQIMYNIYHKLRMHLKKNQDIIKSLSRNRRRVLLMRIPSGIRQTLLNTKIMLM